MGWLVLPLAALGAGILSFTSPCCLPLIPGYLSYVSALPVSELGSREARLVTFRASLRFVAGFAVVFTALGVSFAFVGAALLRHVPFLVRVAGVGIIVMGLAMTGLVRVPALMRERRPFMSRVSPGSRGAFGLGMAFAIGWVPCIGPVLATILTAAAVTRTAAWGGLLLVVYSIGLGLPFIALGVGFQQARRSTEWLRRNGRRLEVLGGVLMVAVGVLFVSGAWQTIFLPLQRSFARFGWPPV